MIGRETSKLGRETDKLLYMGVCNKYYSTCTYAEKTPQEHDCYKNWDRPSASMETDNFARVQRS